MYAIHPEILSAQSLREELAVEREIGDIVRQLCDDPAELTDWLDEQGLLLTDIQVKTPTGRTVNAARALLQAARDCERGPAQSTAWVIEQIAQWLQQRPEVAAEAKKNVEGRVAPRGRSEP
jgi:hypothetical protein